MYIKIHDCVDQRSYTVYANDYIYFYIRFNTTISNSVQLAKIFVSQIFQIVRKTNMYYNTNTNFERQCLVRLLKNSKNYSNSHPIKVKHWSQ